MRDVRKYFVAGMLNLLCGAGNLTKFGLQARNTQNDELIRIRMINYTYTFTRVFVYTSRAIKIY